jgi:hypothetical protein
MELPFGDHIPQGYYEMALEEARPLLGEIDERLVSLKIRPIQKWPIESDDQFHTAYVYRDEYAMVHRWLSASSLNQVQKGRVSRGPAITLRSMAGDNFVFVEHETGPEIIMTLTLVTASLGLIKEVVGLVKEILKSINEKNEAKRRGEEVRRHYEASAISIEVRTSDSSRVINIIPLPIKAADLDETKIANVVIQSMRD